MEILQGNGTTNPTNGKSTAWQLPPWVKNFTTFVGKFISEQDTLAYTAVKYSRGIVGVCAIWFVLWSGLPALLVETAYIDVAENIEWGRHFQFGYDKNPYFGAWLTRLAYELSGGSLWINYILSQLSVLIALVCVWKLSRNFLAPAYSFLSVVFLLGITFYSTAATEFNDDVMEIGLWALTMLFFHRALLKRKTTDWLWLGLFAGLSFMTKYLGVIIFIPMALMLFITEEGRQSFRKAGLYCCAVVFLIITLPNIWWLFQNDFVAVKYAMERSAVESDKAATWISHFTSPLYFIKRQLEILLPPVIAFFAIFYKRSRRREFITEFNRKYILMLALGPLALVLLFSLVSGGRIRFTWMTPCFSLSGILLVMFWQPHVSLMRARLFMLFITIFALVCMIGFSHSTLFKKPYSKRGCSYEVYPGKVIAQDLTRLWHEHYRVGIKYVVGERRETCYFSLYSPDRPLAYFSARHEYSQWIDERDILKHGAVVIWEGNLEAVPPWLVKFTSAPDKVRFFNAKKYPRAVKWWFRKLIGREPLTDTVSYAFIQPEKDNV